MIEQIIKVVLAMGSKSTILTLANLLSNQQRGELRARLLKVRSGGNKELITFIDDVLDDI